MGDIFGLVWEKRVLKPKSVVASGLNAKSRVLSDLKLPFAICVRPGPRRAQNPFKEAQFEHFGGFLGPKGMRKVRADWGLVCCSTYHPLPNGFHSTVMPERKKAGSEEGLRPNGPGASLLSMTPVKKQNAIKQETTKGSAACP